MSTSGWFSVDTEELRADLTSARERLLVVLFGDYVGLTIFCGILFVLGLTWRQSVFINDNYAVANALVAVEEGHLDLRRAAYGPSLGTPGVFEGADGRPYARNYAQVFLALPVLVLLRGLAVVIDLRLFLLGVWVLLLLWTLRGAGRAVGREQELTIAGATLGFGFFVVGIPFATELPGSWLPFLALQVVSAIATGFIGVLGYRLLSDVYGRRVGVGGAVAMVFGTTLAFWGTIPKRHVLAACLTMVAAYCLYRSRVVARRPSSQVADERDWGLVSPRVGYRASAYATVGIVAWVGVPEAVALGLAIFLADFLTSERPDWLPRAVLVIGLLSSLALVPFLATNTVMAGNPFEPPLGLSGYQPPDDAAEGAATPTPTPRDSADATTTPSPVSPTETPRGSPVASPTGSAAPPGGGGGPDIEIQLPLSSVTNRLADGVAIVTKQPDRLYHVFVKSQYTTRGTGRANTIPGANLAVLEAAPLLGGFVGFVVLGAQRGARGFRAPSQVLDGIRNRDFDPLRSVDIFAGWYTVLLILLYVRSLPLHAMINTRYLLPAYPLLAYGVVRLPAVRRAIDRRWQLSVWAYLGTVFIGGQLLLAVTALFSTGVGESMQALAMVNLLVAGLVATWAVAATLAAHRPDWNYVDSVGAILIGVAAALGSIFVILTTIVYFSHAEFLLPLIPNL